jgi:hypothetical protein
VLEMRAATGRPARQPASAAVPLLRAWCVDDVMASVAAQRLDENAT